MTNRRQPWDFDPFAFSGNVRSPYELHPTDELWWQEYAAAIQAFHDNLPYKLKPPA